MNKELQRIKIAEACGWKPDKRGLGWLSPHGYYAPEPDYLNDLNAMHGAWHTLDSKHKRLAFHEQLRRKVIADGGHKNSTQGDIDCCCENATAAQRAEAFLRTLNLWEE